MSRPKHDMMSDTKLFRTVIVLCLTFFVLRAGRDGLDSVGSEKLGLKLFDVPKLEEIFSFRALLNYSAFFQALNLSKNIFRGILITAKPTW